MKPFPLVLRWTASPPWCLCIQHLVHQWTPLMLEWLQISRHSEFCWYNASYAAGNPSTCAAGDRLASLVILGSLILLDTDERHRQLFSGMLALDISETSKLLYTYDTFVRFLSTTVVPLLFFNYYGIFFVFGLLYLFGFNLLYLFFSSCFCTFFWFQATVRACFVQVTAGAVLLSNYCCTFLVSYYSTCSVFRLLQAVPFWFSGYCTFLFCNTGCSERTPWGVLHPFQSCLESMWDVFIKILENVCCEYDRWVVETRLCKLRDTSDTLIGRACAMFHG